MSQKAWMQAYTKGSKSLQARLAKIHANNPEFQDFVKKHGFGGNLSKKQSEKQKVSSSPTVKPVDQPNPETKKGPADREAMIKAAARKIQDRRAAASNRVAFGGELGGGFSLPNMGFRTYREETEREISDREEIEYSNELKREKTQNEIRKHRDAQRKKMKKGFTYTPKKWVKEETVEESALTGGREPGRYPVSRVGHSHDSLTVRRGVNYGGKPVFVSKKMNKNYEPEEQARLKAKIKQALTKEATEKWKVTDKDDKHYTMKNAKGDSVRISRKVWDMKKGGVLHGSKSKRGTFRPTGLYMGEDVPYKDASYTMRRGGWVVKRNGKVTSIVLPTEDHAKAFIDSTRATLATKVGAVIRRKAKEIARGMGRYSYATESAANRRRIRSWDSAIMPELKPLTVKPKSKVPFDADPPKKNPGVVVGRNDPNYSRARHLARLGLKKAMEKSNV